MAQANTEMSALVHAARNILFQLSKQCETQCALHSGLIFRDCWQWLVLCLMVTLVIQNVSNGSLEPLGVDHFYEVSLSTIIAIHHLYIYIFPFPKTVEGAKIWRD